MSDLAASGGYFVAAGCDMIFAEPMTITGSIGIFYGKFDLVGPAQEARRHDRHVQARQARRRREHVPAVHRRGARRAARQAALHVRPVRRRGRRGPRPDEGRGRRGRPRPRLHRRAGQADQARRSRSAGSATRSTRHVRACTCQPHAKLDLEELPKIPTSLLGVIGNLFSRAPAELPLSELPVFKALVRGVPPSLLAEPDAAQMRLPYVLEVSE